jgi:hypothetical protein
LGDVELDGGAEDDSVDVVEQFGVVGVALVDPVFGLLAGEGGGV